MKSNKRIIATLLVLILLVCSGCMDNEESVYVDMYKDKKCFSCRKNAQMFTTGAKIENCPDECCEEVMPEIYRTFYCNDCFDKMPVVDGDWTKK